MAVKGIKRKLVWEEKGVSEIIGTILMLSLTVVMFSGIIAYVGRMPAPQESFNVEVDCYIVPNNPGNRSEGVNFTMIHQGGKVLDSMWIRIIISVDQSVLIKNLDDGLQDENGDDSMGVGEYWIYFIDAATVGGVPTLSSNSTFSITIIHQEKNLLVWQETLGTGHNVYKPIIIRMWIDSDLGTPEVDDPGPISYLGGFKIYAEIKDPEGIGGDQGLDLNNLWVNLSSIYGKFAPPVQLNDTVDDRDALNDDVYVAICNAPNRTYAPVGYHYFYFIAYDNSGNHDEEFKLFPIGMIVGANPQIVVRGDFGEKPEEKKYEYIKFSDSNPINGDIITITAIILNSGGGSAQVDVKFYDGEVNESLVIGTYNMLLHAQAERDASVSWEATPGGVHNIIVTAEVNETYAIQNDVEDDYPPDNWNSTNISVMPKILLVDDDGHLNDMTDGDTVKFMRASLEATDFDYDFLTVGAGDGPGYDYGDYPLQEYDVVIWMTGYQGTGALTYDSNGEDIVNLQKFLKGDSTGGNGGSLWLISQSFFMEASGGGTPGTFAQSYLHVPPLITLNESLPTEIYGNNTHLVTDYYADNPINSIVRISGTGNVGSWSYLDVANPDNVALVDNATNPSRVYGITYDSDEVGGNITDSRILSQTWDFSRIEDTSTQAQYTYKAIMWLGKIEMKFTKDVAISEQTIEPKTVFFKQAVTINFVVRNNGFDNYSQEDNLWYLLRITDISGQDIVKPHLERIKDLGTGNNNTLTISYPWIPKEIGYHRVIIKIDPYNYIEESNELNNEISSFLASGDLFVQYRILVVDDDGTFNINGPNSIEETENVTNSLDYLNATGAYSYETYVVNSTVANGPAFLPDVNGVGLSEYNAVIWVGGEADNPLTDWDRTNISFYMDIGGNFWFIGNGMWDVDTDPCNSFEQNYLKIATVQANEDMASVFRGKTDDDVSHGMLYDCSGDAEADRLWPNTDGIGFTYQNEEATMFNSVRYEGTTPTTDNTYRAVTSAWLLSSLDSNDSKAEFTFMVLRWFDKPESRIEARVNDVDIWISDDHPQLGSGYVIQAEIYNTGGASGNILARFMDGNTQIGSQSVTVSPGGKTTAEMIWVPLFAGQRTISIQLDPIREVDEIFEWSNNNATKNTVVYFFWDDMESGTSKWTHSSTTLLINGEDALEYFHDTALDTNIISEWNTTQSNNVTNCRDLTFYHSHDTSYWFQEPLGDASGSSGTRASIPGNSIMTTSTYNYAGVSQATNDHFAWFCDVDDSSSAELTTPNFNPEFIDGQYDQAEASDNLRAVASLPGAQDEIFTKCQMRIAENPTNIRRIDLTFEIQSAGNSPIYTIWAYNQVTSTWDQIGTSITGVKNIDIQFTKSITASMSNYISGIGDLLWGCYCDSSNVAISVDYLEAAIIYGDVPNTPTFVSHGTNTTAQGGESPFETPSLNWNFSDPDGDPQERFIVNVYLDSDDSQVWTSNEVVSSNMSITVGDVGVPLGTNLMNGMTYWWNCQVADDTDWSGTGGGKGNWYFTVNISLNKPPSIPFNPYPGVSVGGVPAEVTLMWECSDLDNDTLTYDLYLDDTNPPTTLKEIGLSTNTSVRILNENTIYYWYVVVSDGNNAPVSGPIWLFATSDAEDIGGVDWSTLGQATDTVNMNKTAVTETMNLTNLESAKLSFWHKYNIVSGINGAFLQVGHNDSPTWKWKYIIPSNAYTGNLNSSAIVEDDFGTRIYWCWNGVSASGTFDWDYVQVNLLNYVPVANRDEVRVKFNYTQWGEGSGYGWYVDDVRVKVTRSDNFNPDANSQDIWNYTNADSHSGNYSWSNVNPVIDPIYGYGLVKPGIDNYLMTTPVDLTNAKNAYLSAYVKFNLNYQSGAPPDGFRIEISNDNGVTWEAANLGVRSGWNISGTGNDLEDDYIDGKAYSGLGDTGNQATDDYWVGLNTLTRVNIDLSSFSGNAIHIRFRMATNGHEDYLHENNLAQVLDPGFGGFWVDDVIVYGETILT